jgi:Domain of unknown function (DUF397)
MRGISVTRVHDPHGGAQVMAEQVTNWRKSSASANGEQCVEVGSASGTVTIRDTQNRAGETLRFPASAWSRFIGSL